MLLGWQVTEGIENLRLVRNFELLSEVVKLHTHVANNASHVSVF